MPRQRTIHRVARPGRNTQPIMNADLGQPHESVHELVDPGGRRRDRLRSKLDPAHLQCAVECPEHSAGGRRDDVIDGKWYRLRLEPKVRGDRPVHTEVDRLARWQRSSTASPAYFLNVN